MYNMYTGTNTSDRKRKICECDTYSVKIRKLEEENKKLQKLCLDQIEEHNRELEKQKKTFQIVLDKEKEAMKGQLKAKNLKHKLLMRKKNRREKKITNMSSLLTTLKKKQLIEQTTLDTLQNDFSDTMLPILNNELRNKGKSMHGRRYSDDLKKFAATLHYHSPKAYAYCRLAPFLLLPFIFINFLLITYHILFY